MIIRYVKKPVEIEAVQFEDTYECVSFLKKWLGDKFKDSGRYDTDENEAWLEIGTLEDGYDQVRHIASEGDYIIKGVHGEFYACKPDIFHETYDMV